MEQESPQVYEIDDHVEDLKDPFDVSVKTEIKPKEEEKEGDKDTDKEEEAEKNIQKDETEKQAPAQILKTYADKIIDGKYYGEKGDWTTESIKGTGKIENGEMFDKNGESITALIKEWAEKNNQPKVWEEHLKLLDHVQKTPNEPYQITENVKTNPDGTKEILLIFCILDENKDVLYENKKYKEEKKETEEKVVDRNNPEDINDLKNPELTQTIENETPVEAPQIEIQEVGKEQLIENPQETNNTEEGQIDTKIFDIKDGAEIIDAKKVVIDTELAENNAPDNIAMESPQESPIEKLAGDLSGDFEDTQDETIKPSEEITSEAETIIEQNIDLKEIQNKEDKQIDTKIFDIKDGAEIIDTEKVVSDIEVVENNAPDNVQPQESPIEKLAGDLSGGFENIQDDTITDKVENETPTEIIQTETQEVGKEQPIENPQETNNTENEQIHTKIFKIEDGKEIINTEEVTTNNTEHNTAKNTKSTENNKTKTTEQDVAINQTEKTSLDFLIDQMRGKIVNPDTTKEQNTTKTIDVKVPTEKDTTEVQVKIQEKTTTKAPEKPTKEEPTTNTTKEVAPAIKQTERAETPKIEIQKTENPTLDTIGQPKTVETTTITNPTTANEKKILTPANPTIFNETPYRALGLPEKFIEDMQKIYSTAPTKKDQVADPLNFLSEEGNNPNQFNRASDDPNIINNPVNIQPIQVETPKTQSSNGITLRRAS
ncbi:MAG: hypothetical protein K9L98_01920 [Candidatus Pacebacteria bacterium]|nr:hypothetical protein [Candidatus Paceibacterota bacterium]MCF7862745.1 hypothetical protein [Candidatus Paceibacterota bacterium]